MSFLRDPAAAALLSEMGYEEEERVQVKKEFLRMMTRMQLDSARERLLYGFFETYLQLTEEEEEQLMEEVGKLSKESEEFIKNLPISYEEKGKEIGKELGKKEVALALLKEGSSAEFISKVTGLEIKEIEELREQF